MTYICCKGVLKKESNDFIYVTENLRLKRSGHHTTDSLKLTGDDRGNRQRHLAQNFLIG